jgi:polyhydroxyalkanoate synthesis regulator phasin
VGLRAFGLPYKRSANDADKLVREIVAAGDVSVEKYNQVVEQMQQLEDNDDTEEAHIEADKLLCSFLRELGYDELVDAFEDIDKWYS